jgi:RND family efflux transporter MFP subunit
MRIHYRPSPIWSALLAWTTLLLVSCAGCRARRWPVTPDRPADLSPSIAPVAEKTPPASYLGVIVAAKTVDLAPSVEGRVDRIFVRPGDEVARGAAVARLDVRALHADLRLAVANLGDARRRLARRAKLDRDAISPEELSEVRVQVADRRTRVQHLRRTLGEAAMPAPFPSVVAARYLDPGSVTGPGRPVVRLVGIDGLNVRFAIPEDETGAVANHDRVRVSVNALAEPLEATVESIAPEVDAAARVTFAVAAVHVPERLKRHVSLGMVARVVPIKAKPPGVN